MTSRLFVWFEKKFCILQLNNISFFYPLAVRTPSPQIIWSSLNGESPSEFYSNPIKQRLERVWCSSRSEHLSRICSRRNRFFFSWLVIGINLAWDDSNLLTTKITGETSTCGPCDLGVLLSLFGWCCYMVVVVVVDVKTNFVKKCIS